MREIGILRRFRMSVEVVVYEMSAVEVAVYKMSIEVAI